ncbi:hypothetical protein D3C87_982740 [compost metagenome]
MSLLHVEEQRAGNRVLAAGNGFGGRNDARNGRDLQTVSVVFIESQAENAKAGLVGIDTSERFGVVAVDVDSCAVLTDCNALCSSLLGVGDERLDDVGRLGFLAAVSHDLLFEDFARAVLGTRDVSGDRYVRQFLVDFRPLLVGVGNELAVLDDFSSEREVKILRLELDVLVGRVHRKDDTVVTDLHFLNVGDASSLTGSQFVALDLARSVCNVDGAFAHARAECLQTTARAAGLNNRSLEVREGFGKSLGNDLGVGQNRGGTGNLDLVASSGGASEGDRSHQSCCGKFNDVHLSLPSWALLWTQPIATLALSLRSATFS